jgi:uncharacterized protein YggU (UPF0235/DUF167 family)
MAEDLRLVVHVKPGSSKGPLVETSDAGQLTIYVRGKAIDGKANEGVILALSDHFKVAKSRITITRGHTSRIKQVLVEQ